MQGYGSGQHAPGVKGKTWECVRHALLAHAAAAAAFKKAKAAPGRLLHPSARLSLNLNANWAEPWDVNNPADVAAAARALAFDLGAFAEPLHTGAWPADLASRALPGLVPFSPAEADALRAARPHFFALNYYTAAWVKDAPGALGEQGQGRTDLRRVQDDPTPGGRGAIGPRAESAWLYSAPWGLRRMLAHVLATYGPPSIALTENGCDAPGEDGAPWPALLNDSFRVSYFQEHVSAAEAAVAEDGVPLEGYFAWSLLDNYECEHWGGESRGQREKRGRRERQERRERRERGGGRARVGPPPHPIHPISILLPLPPPHILSLSLSQGPTATPSGLACCTWTTPPRPAASRRPRSGWRRGSAGRPGRGVGVWAAVGAAGRRRSGRAERGSAERVHV